MTNPVTKFELRDFAPDDISKIMENFFDLVSWATYETVHGHHIQIFTVDISGQAATSGVAYTGGTWPQAYPQGVVPRVQLTPNSTNAVKPAALERLQYCAYNITQTGCDIFVQNLSSAAVGAGSFIVVQGIDPTFNTSLA